MLFELPGSVQGEGPTMATLVETAQILEHARSEAPLSLAEIERRMVTKRAGHDDIQACIELLEQLGFVVMGSKGVQWTHTTSEDLRRAAATGREL